MDWVAVLASLPAIISGLGEHLPGILIAGAMVYLYRQREKEHDAAKARQLAECKECEKNQREVLEKALAALQTVSERMAAYERDLEISAQIAGLVAERKLREGHANADRPGQN